MIFTSIVMMAMTVHPRLLNFLVVAINCGWLILTREVARYEGAAAKVCWRCIIGASAIMAICIFVIMKVNWLSF